MSNTTISALPAIGSLDVVALIQAIHEIQGQAPGQRDLDRYAGLTGQLCKVTRCAVLQLGSPLRVLGRSFPDDSWMPDESWFEPGGLGQRALVNSFAHEPVRGVNGLEAQIVLIRMHGSGNEILYFDLPSHDRTRLNDAVLRGLLVADLPQPVTVSDAGAGQHHELLTTIDYSAEVMRMDEFTAAAVSLVNGAVSKLNLEFAALCWVQNHRCKVKAISHLNQFDRDTDQVREIEAAAAEMLEFDQALSWPTSFDSFYEGQLHAIPAMAASQSVTAVCTLPMHTPQGDVSAVLVIAATMREIPAVAIAQLQMALDLIQPRMQELHDKQLHWWDKAKIRILDHLSRFLGPELVLPKAAGILFFLLLLLSNIIPWRYNIDAATELVTDSTRALSAQFDGRIDEVFASTGDGVTPGMVLALLDTRELKQQEIELAGEIARNEAELRKARAGNALADVEIFQARLDEVQAKYARLQESMSQAALKAPFEGIIVEGERRELLGAPVKRGDKMFRIAKTENLYVSLLVSEKEIKDVHIGSSGIFSLLSRPDQEVKFMVTAIIPMAQVKGQDGNHFQVKASIKQLPEGWWRPGMTGLAKIDAGSRPIFWLLTHKMVDYLRMKLWF